ncbi:hemerythrin domain-containing protein [Acidiferrimicrobium sp. IK]|uniref:hemerythrin domain-containing protein n=1 Tax=Acidiferrimicrobium sp. IK TaxID=2871700 RepID=UPI0021CB77FB|nr:hemerythrin domain-containing protein [Acidiferrimicrobium sp. IK]MCU4183121.1 hemerythrin domain-containing protein [Acidiferrimicrobium sp. IK]
MKDLIEAVSADHARIRRLLADMTSAADAAPVIRDRALHRLSIADSRHEVAEEQYLWPVVRDAVIEGAELARTGLGQEQRVKRELHDLEGGRVAPEDLVAAVASLSGAFSEHLALEENVVVPRLREALSQEQLDDFGRSYRAARRGAPSRPRPRTPPVPGLLRASSRVLGPLDRVRDLLTGRSW